jgi:Saxitoxin biosynthesis operon protein SxtJ
MSIKKELQALATDKASLSKFGLQVGGVFLLIAAALAGLALSRDLEPGKLAFALAGIGGFLVIFGVLVPTLLRPIFIGWMALAFLLGSIMSPLILAVFFFLVLTPVALLFKLIGRDALNRRFDKNAGTYWITKEYLIKDRSRFEKFF